MHKLQGVLIRNFRKMRNRYFRKRLCRVFENNSDCRTLQIYTKIILIYKRYES